jgi:hypothetical protein
MLPSARNSYDANRAPGKSYWCRGLFTDYAIFGVKSRLLFSANSLGGF